MKITHCTLIKRSTQGEQAPKFIRFMGCPLSTNYCVSFKSRPRCSTGKSFMPDDREKANRSSTSVRGFDD